MIRLVGEVRRRSGRWLRMLGLLRHVPPGTLAATLVLNVVLGLLPLGFVVAMSVLLQGVPAAVGGDATAWTALLSILFVAAAVVGGQQLLAPFQAAAGELVMRHVDGRCRVLLMRAALVDTPAMALDDARLLDDVNAAREAFDRASASPGDAAAGVLALVARYTQLVGAVVLVGVTLSPPAAVVIGVTALVIRFGQRGSLGRFGDFWDGLAGDRRKVTYLKSLASGPQAAKEIRLLGLVGWLRDRHRRDDLHYLTTMWRGRRALLGAPFLVLSAIGLVGAAIVFVLLAGRGADGGLSLLELGIALQAVLILMRFGVYFPEADVQTQYGSLAYEALLAFRDGGRALRPLAAGKSLSAQDLPRRSIRFEDVGFRYRPDGPDVLEGLDLEVPAGTSLAVVGLNGAGKTTLVKLLTRLYDPTAGRVSIDGHDLRDVDPREWHRRLAVIFQDYVRYELPVADNISLGAPEFAAGEDDLLAVARRSGAAEVIATMPDGLRTVLSSQYEGGRDLSGGQWQRVALARALHAVHAGASVMILDEPTAQLDVRAEVEFFDRFLDITRGLTTVIISHRFSTVRRADQIVVLEHGRVAERGTHDELLAQGGRYATLFRLQAERFADDTAAPLLDSAMDEVS
ncbi:ATP-binding cassette domain-containing protein [Lentzea sp. NPDC003310]|uniref:ABC transporter ATP-binding protein n=1 Tax=Lentzea sp. NPDC003310 TaxID=3154447 RepID=UPI0033B38F5C